MIVDLTVCIRVVVDSIFVSKLYFIIIIIIVLPTQMIKNDFLKFVRTINNSLTLMFKYTN